MLRTIFSIFHQSSSQSWIYSTTMGNKSMTMHRDSLDEGRHPDINLQFLWDRDGNRGFEFHILERCSANELGERVKFQKDYAEKCRQTMMALRSSTP